MTKRGLDQNRLSDLNVAMRKVKIRLAQPFNPLLPAETES